MELTADDIRGHREEVTEHAKEVMDHLYQAILRTPEFTLRDGTKCRVDESYPPEEQEDGELKCGIDVLMDDGTHVEFTLAQTGWGKPVRSASGSIPASLVFPNRALAIQQEQDTSRDGQHG
jgi:hypothetical protein